jgi:hypothetical protein
MEIALGVDVEYRKSPHIFLRSVKHWASDYEDVKSRYVGMLSG